MIRTLIMKINFIYLIISIFFINSAEGQNFPFPQNLTYSNGIKPTISQGSMNDAIRNLYDLWKSKYLYDRGTDSSGHQMYSVNCNESENGDTVSEGQGYGMLIMVMLAGYDNNAKYYFDGLYWFFKKYQNSNGLMKWYVDASGNASKGDDNATDGDLDIALSLIMADVQWGSSGSINYQSIAGTLIDAIKSKNVDTLTTEGSYDDNDWSIRPGDWWTTDNDHIVRTSDFMPSHFRIFSEWKNDGAWTNVLNRTYELINSIQSNDSPSTGLLSDFAAANTSRAVTGQVLESSHDKDYHYNACRDPWRITIDYLLSGDNRAKKAMDKIAYFIKNKTGENPANVKNGYYLDGTSYGSSPSLAFVSPFGVAGMVSNVYQTWVDAVFNYCDDKTAAYYEDSINLLSLLVMSGNWWNPMSVPQKYITGLIFPEYDSQLLPGQEIKFQWASRAGVNLYKLEVAFDNSFSSVVTGFPITTSSTYYSVTLAIGTYYWRVSCSTNKGDYWERPSAVGKFKIKTLISSGEIIAYPTMFSEGEMVVIDYKVENELLPSISGIKSKIIVYNLYGKKIYEKEIELNSGEFLGQWNGKDNDGVSVSPGIYIIKIVNAYFEKTTRVFYK